jgi:hypothetical protein
MGAATIGALVDPAHAREDWRGAARALGSTPAVVVAPAYDDVPLRWYRRTLRAAPAGGIRTEQLAVVLTDPKRNPLPPGALAAPPARGFSQAGRETRNRILIARYRAARPQTVRPQEVSEWARTHLDAARGQGGAALLARR